MSIVDWKQFLKSDSELPSDVFFHVSEEKEGGGGEDLEEKGGEVGAHRLLLAGASPVFRRQFFGSLRETAEVVTIRGTTVEAFRTLVDYIYSPPGQFSLDHIWCPSGLFHIVNIAEKYQLPGLRLIAKERFSNCHKL